MSAKLNKIELSEEFMAMFMAIVSKMKKAKV